MGFLLFCFIFCISFRILPISDTDDLYMLFPEPVNQKAEAVMKSARMTLAEHMATAFSEAEIDSEILLLTMNTSQKKKIASEYGTDISVYTLTEYVGVDGEILNPYGKALNSYGECMEKLSELIDKLTEKLNSFAEE